MCARLPSSAPFLLSLVELGVILQSVNTCTAECIIVHIAPTLEKVRSPPTHPRMDVSFGGFNVVMEVIAESLNMGDDFFSPCGGEVTGEKDCNRSAVRDSIASYAHTECDVADLSGP